MPVQSAQRRDGSRRSAIFGIVSGIRLDVLNEPEKSQRYRSSIKKAYDPDTVAVEYEKLFEGLMKKK